MAKSYGQHIYLSPEIGYGYTTFNDYAEKSKYQSDIGNHLHYGLGIYIPFTNNLYFSGKALYQNRHAIYLDDNTVKPTDSSSVSIFTLKSIGLPMNFMYYKRLPKNRVLTVGIGATYTYILSGDIRYTTYGSKNTVDPDEDWIIPQTFGRGLGNMFKNHYWALNLNAGYKFKGGLYFNLYTNIGITNLVNNSTWSNGSSRIFESGIMAGYWLPINKYKTHWH